MRGVKQLLNLCFGQRLFEFLILILHLKSLLAAIREGLVGIVLLAFEETAGLIVRWQFGSILRELLDPLIRSFFISVFFLPSSFILSTYPRNYYFLSIIFLKFVVSTTLLIFPLASGMIGSSGENLHYPSTMNLYLHLKMLTDGVLEGVAV